MLQKIKQTADFLKNRFGSIPDTAVVLGTGLGNLAADIKNQNSLAYKDIPNFPVSTVEGHEGRLIVGTLGDKQVLAMEGRFHYYEGYDMKQVTFPVRVMVQLGVKTLLLSNAAGGINPSFRVGDIMIIRDHINMFPENPLRGTNYDELGPRFPNMDEVYSKRLIDRAIAAAKKLNIEVRQGVYVGTQGPSFETPSEFHFFRVIGGDAVGMSTIPEAIVAKHAGIECFALSVITNMGGVENATEVSHKEVQEAANSAQPKMTALMKEIIKSNN